MSEAQVHTEPLLRPGTEVGRWRVLEPVGTGGMAVVYRLEDTQAKGFAALKLLNSRALDRSGAKMLATEFRVIVRLKHPNVVQALDYVDIEGRPGLVMEFVEGALLSEIMGSGMPSDGAERGAAAVGLLRQMADALTCLHAEKVVHLDLKPQNLIQTSDGRLRLMDFGISRTGFTETDFMRERTVLGTPAYMSPEQISGEALDHRTDLYALGVIAYEMLAGRQPIRPADGDEGYPAWHKAITRGRPERLRKLAPDAPPALVDLIERLMSKSPDKRPPSADAVLGELEALASKLDAELPEDAGQFADKLHAAPIVGREALAERAVQMLEAARKGQGAWRVLHGPAGSGRSAALAQIAEAARAAGFAVYQTVCPPSPRDEFVGLKRYVLEGLAVLDEGEPGIELRAATQVLRDLLVGATSAEDPEARRRSVAHAIELMTRELGKRGPLLLLTDDLHYADAGTLALWRHLSRRVAARSPIVTLATVDRGRRGAEAVVRRAGIERIPDVVLWALPPLDHEGVRALSEAMLGQPPPPLLTASLHEASGGHPALAVEALRSLVDGGALIWSSSSGFTLGEDSSRVRADRMPVSPRLRRVVLRMLRPLGEAERNLLASIALAENAPEALLEQVVDLDLRTLRDAAARLESRGLARRQEKELDVPARLVARAVHSALAANQRALLHREIARAAMALWSRDDESSPELEARSEWMARQYLGAGMENTALDHLIVAAERHYEAERPNRASELLDRAHELLSSGRVSGREQRSTRLIGIRVDVRQRLGDAEGAARDAAQLLARSRFRGDHVLHTRAARAALEAERMRGRLVAGREAATLAVELARKVGGDALVLSLCSAGELECAGGDLEAAQTFVSEALAVARVGGDTPGFCHAAVTAALLHTARGEVAAARWQMGSIETATNARGGPALIEPLEVKLRRLRLASVLHLRAGNLAGARMAASRAAAMAREHGAVEWECEGRLVDAEVCMAVGDPAAASRSLADVQALAPEALRPLRAKAAQVAAWLQLERSDLEGAREALAKAQAATEGVELRPVVQRTRLLEGEVLGEAGDADGAFAVATEVEVEPASAWLRLDALLLKCAALRGRGAPKAAVAPARAALEMAERLRSWESMLAARYQLGMTLILVEEDEEGIAVLRDAVAQVEESCRGWSRVDAERLRARPLVRRIMRSAGVER